MCGRFVTPEIREIEDFWHIGRRNWRNPFEPPAFARYNVAPQQGNPRHHIPVIRVAADGVLELTDMQWWLLPFWSKEPKIKYSTFNARVEAVTTSASFREPFKRRRCIIPALGWYEWQSLASGKQPWFFHAANSGQLGFAGLWDRWARDEHVVESCTILVGEANEKVRPIHNRMPLRISPEQRSAWLDPGVSDPGEVIALLLHPDDDVLDCHPVSKKVGSVSNDGTELIEPEWSTIRS